MSRLRIILLGWLVVLLAACSIQSAPISAPSNPTSIPPTLSALTSKSPTPLSPTPVTPAFSSPVPLTSTPAVQPTTIFPNPDDYTWQLVTSGLNKPVSLANAADGSGRLFILEQVGEMRILKGGPLLPMPFLDIHNKVSCCGERGLLGIAFHPKFIENGYFYVNYDDKAGNTVIARFKVSAQNPDQADPASETRLLYVQQPFPNHKGGELAFGPDGYLYIGLGDGGNQGDPLGNGQSLDTLLAKILRIDVDHGNPYAIPPDNPFARGGGLPEIWAYGLRNPWRFSFDRKTGDLYIADVGQDKWEEIDYLAAKSPGRSNFGWSYFEGNHPYKGTPPPGVKFVDPVAEYGHDQGCAVVGGFVYRGMNLPAWQGVYLYGDYCSGNGWGLHHNPDDTWVNSLLFNLGVPISSFGEDESGEVYLVDYNGNILRLSKK